MLKRLFDVVTAACGLLMLSPLLLLVGVLIRLGSPGPIFFRQRRLGRGFVPFQILKFRTLTHQGCDRQADQLTAVGALLRRFKLNELPQLLNVLRGEMSLVGPRPELPDVVECFREDYIVLLSVRPGITDPASIAYCREAELMATFDDPEKAYEEHILPHKIALSRAGLERSSVPGDLLLLIRTVGVVIGRRPLPPCPPAVDPIP